MATLSYQQATVAGTAHTTQAAGASGDKVAPNDRGFVFVKNGSASPITVTVADPGETKYGQANPDIPVAVAAGATKLIGPLRSDLAAEEDGLVALTYSDNTDVTVAALSV